MKNNITLVIGDNASGKTRYLNSLKESYRKSGLKVVTNLDKYDNINAACDMQKYKLFREEGTEYFNSLFDSPILFGDDKYVKSIIDLPVQVGDILIIDNIDHLVTRQQLIDLCSTLSQIRDYWQRIIVSGYNYEIERIFTKKDFDEDLGYYEQTLYNCVYLDKDGNITELTDEGEVDEYMDKIRG
jgi:hypothetical protein